MYPSLFDCVRIVPTIEIVFILYIQHNTAASRNHCNCIYGDKRKTHDSRKKIHNHRKYHVNRGGFPNGQSHSRLPRAAKFRGRQIL